MVLLDVSIVNVALQSIRESSLKPSGDEIQWVLAGYALTFGLLLVPAGRLGDVRGRRTVFLWGVALFTAASVLCGAAQSGIWLVIARLAQGLAGGLLTPQITAIIQQQFKGPERAKAFGLFGAMVGIATAIGPLLGGVLITIFGNAEGWRYVFFVNIPIGAAVLAFGPRFLPGATAGQRDRRKHDYDPVGVVLLGAGVVVLLLPFVQEQTWKGSAKWLLVPLAAVLLGLFVLWEFRYRRRQHEPMVDMQLFNRRSYSFGTAIITLYFAGFVPLFFIFSLLLQSPEPGGLGYSALLAGVATVPFAVGSGVSAVIGGKIVDRAGRSVIAAGLVMVAMGFVGVWLAVHEAGTDHLLGWYAAGPLLLAGFGSGLVISPNQTLTLSQVPPAQGGSAGGVLQVGQRVGSAIGIAAVGSVFYARLASTRGEFPDAVQHGLIVAFGFVVAALVVSAADVLVNRSVERRAHGDEQGAARPAGQTAVTAEPAASTPT
ncbi:MFS transporter [Jatrophihabitans sp. YIM 134969]